MMPFKLGIRKSKKPWPVTVKLADVTPLPKQKPVKEIKKDLRPISLTPCISKLAEDFVVTEYMKPAV